MIPSQYARLALLIAGALLLGATLRHAIAPAPVPSVIDDAALLSEGERRSITRYHEELLADQDIDYRVVTRLTGADIDEAGYQAFAELGVGERSGSGRGLLLLIDPSADGVRLEVAAALEGVFTDAFVAYVEQRQMVPFFRGGRVADGILATTELIVARAQQAAAGEAFDPATLASFSLGGGASTAARIGAGPEHARLQDGSEVAPQATPEATVVAYLGAMAERNARSDLAIYSAESRRMLRSWTMTPAQMDSVVRTYRGCRRGEVRYGAGAELAVIRYTPAARQCAPWFLRREEGRWTLDLAAPQRVLRFNHRNEWRMPDSESHAYAFAFTDWRFDRHGFPIETR